MRDSDSQPPDLAALADRLGRSMDQAVEDFRTRPAAREVGEVLSVSRGVARVRGLPGATSEELVRFEGGELGMVFNVDPGQIGVVLLDDSEGIDAGDRVERTERVMDFPVGDALLGRTVDGAGRPLDERGEIEADERRVAEKTAPAIMDRAPVSEPLQTGLKVVDALIPVGRGQRELIVGDRQTGKTAVAVDTIINQKGRGVLCIYCAIGQRGTGTARVVADLDEHDARAYTTVIATTEEDPPALQWMAAYAAMTAAEHWMENGRDVLVVYDDMTHHARAYRELSLLLRRPPGREAYPGDIFYVHSRLLERSTHLADEKGGGSVTALPIVETQAQNISAYIPTNLISITDGQIYLSPDQFSRGVLPAVDVGRSVSRVGGRAQLAAYRAVAKDLKLAYSQFEELERFSRYGTRLEEEKRRQLERGRRVREVLNQDQFSPMPVAEQIAVLLAVTEGFFDRLDVDEIMEASDAVREGMRDGLPDLGDRIAEGEELADDDRQALRDMITEAIKPWTQGQEGERAGEGGGRTADAEGGA